jgi:glycosyltransferase involved in cell wall biosynthesis
LAHAESLVAVSGFEAALFQRALGLGEDRFTVIRNGFEMPTVRESAATEASQAPAGPVILSIGRLERYKGHHRAIGAMETVLASHPNAELHIVGTGPYEPQLRRLAQRSGAASHVRFVNFPPDRRGDLGSLVARSHLVTLLSEYEAHPVAVMEAVGLRRRVLVADNSGLHELAEQGLASEVSLDRPDREVGEVMAELLLSPPVRASVELQTWDGCADRLADLYRTVLQRVEGSSA